MGQIFANCEFEIYDAAGVRLRIGLRSGVESTISRENLLYLDHLDPYEYAEVWGLRRVDKEFVAASKGREGLTSLQTVTKFATYLFPLFFIVSEERPLLWICGIKNVGLYEKVLSQRYRFEVLRGSYNPENKYPPLALWREDVGGSEDEHIVRLSLPRPAMVR